MNLHFTKILFIDLIKICFDFYSKLHYNSNMGIRFTKVAEKKIENAQDYSGVLVTEKNGEAMIPFNYEEANTLKLVTFENSTI